MNYPCVNFLVEIKALVFTFIIAFKVGHKNHLMRQTDWTEDQFKFKNIYRYKIKKKQHHAVHSTKCALVPPVLRRLPLYPVYSGYVEGLGLSTKFPGFLEVVSKQTNQKFYTIFFLCLIRRNIYCWYPIILIRTSMYIKHFN